MSNIADILAWAATATRLAAQGDSLKFVKEHPMAKQLSATFRTVIPVLFVAALFGSAAGAQAQPSPDKRAEEAAVSADVQRVLRLAIQDYPVLATPAGQPLLTRIMNRQLALKAQGVYPSVAMVEAISDNVHVLGPRPTQQAQVVSSNTTQPRVVTGCRWVTPIKRTCD